MPRHLLTICLLVVAAAPAPLCAQAHADPYAKIIGTWAIDSMNGAGDTGVPKSQTLTMSHATGGIRILAVTDDSTGRNSLDLLCSAAANGATRDLGSGQIARCTFRPTPDSVLYTLVIRKNDQIIASEHGRLVASDHMLRDEYDASQSGQSGHYRHVYSKQ